MVFNQSNDRFFMERKWMYGYRSFSFQDYYDENKNEFGNIVALNQEWIKPGKGFGFHPTHNIALLTFVTQGILLHGNDFSRTNQSMIVEPGDFQLLSTGEGCHHYEKNASKDNMLSYWQIWFSPCLNERPDYQLIKKESYQGQAGFRLLFSDQQEGCPKICKGVRIWYGSDFKRSQLPSHSQNVNNKYFMIVLQGDFEFNNRKIFPGDTVQWRDEKIDLTCSSDSACIVIEME